MTTKSSKIPNMLSIKETGVGYYLASLTGHSEVLGRIECILIKKEIRPVLKPHREITINLKGIKSIETPGFNILRELKLIADASRCKIRFINAEPAIAGKLAVLTKKSSQQHNQLEIDNF